MSWPSNQPPDLERVFVIEFVDACDAVARLLGAFVVQGCRLTALDLEPQGHTARLSLHAKGLDALRADHLRLRLEAMPLVRGVSLGWRGEVAAPPIGQGSSSDLLDASPAIEPGRETG